MNLNIDVNPIGSYLEEELPPISANPTGILYQHIDVYCILAAQVIQNLTVILNSLMI